MAQLRELLNQGRIGTMILPNRLVMAPMRTLFATEGGYVTPRMIAYYEERAKGKVGLIVVEPGCVDTQGKGWTSQLAVYSDEFVPGLRELTDAIHKHGARAAIQLFHSGGATRASVTHQQPIAPSPVSAVAYWGTMAAYDRPREVTAEGIRRVVQSFGEAANRARLAGFDAVELHAGREYLFGQFLSPRFSQRQDEYGGSTRNRARLLLETIKAAKEKAGQNFPVWPRLNWWDFGLEGGTPVTEAQEICRMVEEAGADAIHIRVSSMNWGLGPQIPPPMAQRPGSFLPLVEAVKEAVSIPVIAVGRIDLKLGEEVLREGRADFIAMGRGLLTDPQVLIKASAGRWDEIAPCIGCMRCVFGKNATVNCTVNAAVAREQEYQITRATKAKRVLIIGGGPAGMEAARVAALRGHEVILYEKGERLGGQLLLAVKPPFKDHLASLAPYLQAQLEKLKVRVELGIEAGQEIIEKAKPDVVIVAAGTIPIIPEIPGLSLHKNKVFLTSQALTTGIGSGRKVVVIGGELVGCETAEVLADKGYEVTVTRRGAAMATRLEPFLREILLPRLSGKNVAMFTGVKYEEVTDKGLRITANDGSKRLLEADSIVLAAGARPDRRIYDELQGRLAEIYLAGDCVEPRGIMEAIHDGAAIAFSL